MTRTNLKNDFNLIGGSYYKDDLPISFDNTRIVKSASDLSGDLSSGTVYIIDGAVDMGTQSITVPPGGLSIAGLNGARDVSVLSSSADNYEMFVTGAGTYSGGVVMESMTVTVTGTSSKVFNLDNDGNSSALDIVGVNFTSCTSLGELTDYRQMFLEACGFIFIEDGVTFNGSWSGLAVANTIALGSQDFTLFKEGTSMTFDGSIRSNVNFIGVTSGLTFMDFQESNITPDSGVLLDGFRTSAADAMPNLPSTSVKVRYSRCTGIRNTYVGGQWVVATPAATSIASANTKYKIAGTVTYSYLQWFTNGGGNNSMTYNSSEMVEAEVKATLTLTGTNNDQVNVWIRHYDASAASYIDISSSGAATLNSSGRAEGVAAFGYVALDDGDRVELWVENLTGGRDVTALSGGLFGVEER